MIRGEDVAIRALIVDDAMFVRNFMQKVLSSLGVEVVAQGENGIEAIQMMEEYKPDILFIDITMPMLDGVSALQKIREKNQEIYIVVVSAMGRQDLQNKALSVGANDFVTKPFVAENINEVLERLAIKK